MGFVEVEVFNVVKQTRRKVMRTGVGLSLLIWMGVFAACGWLTGCAVMGSDFVMAGSEKGIRAFSDFSNGLASTGKNHEEHFKLRRLQETEETVRLGQPGALSRIFGRREQAEEGR